MWRRSKAGWSSRSTSVARPLSRSGMSGMADPSGGSGFLVAARIEQLVEIRGIGGLDAEDPRGERVLVHALGRGGELAVGRGDLPGYRRVDVGCGLHRFDHADRLARGDLAPGLGRLDEHDVAELLLRMVGDADAHGAVGLAARPFVRGGVAQLLGEVHLACLSSMRIFPWRTNGAFTTRAASALSRTCTRTVSPGLVPSGRRASAMELPSVGENVPLVISPSPSALSTFWWARSTPPESMSTRPRNSWRLPFLP